MMNLGENSFVASKQVPFATHFTTQVLNCPARNVTQQIASSSTTPLSLSLTLTRAALLMLTVCARCLP